jgi:hypothetical protein
VGDRRTGPGEFAVTEHSDPEQADEMKENDEQQWLGCFRQQHNHEDEHDQGQPSDPEPRIAGATCGERENVGQ